MSDEVFDKVMAKGKERQEKQKERKENPTEKKLEVERTDTGLYTVRYEGGGPLPEVLRTTYTSLYKLKQAVVAHYGKDITTGA